MLVLFCAIGLLLTLWGAMIATIYLVRFWKKPMEITRENFEIDA